MNETIFKISFLIISGLIYVKSQGIEVLPLNQNSAIKRIGSVKGEVTTLLNKPFSPTTYASMSSYMYRNYGDYISMDIYTNESCRLNSMPCFNSDQCCSKFCRCTQWSTTGKETCSRRCL